jgi:hypothetical protein
VRARAVRARGGARAWRGCGQRRGRADTASARRAHERGARGALGGSCELSFVGGLRGHWDVVGTRDWRSIYEENCFGLGVFEMPFPCAHDLRAALTVLTTLPRGSDCLVVERLRTFHFGKHVSPPTKRKDCSSGTYIQFRARPNFATKPPGMGRGKMVGHDVRA